MAIVTEDRTWTWAQRFPTAEEVDKQSVAVFDDTDLGTPRTIIVIRCDSCGERLAYLNLIPNLEGDCAFCGAPLIVE